MTEFSKPAKEWWKSRMFWLNVFVVLVALWQLATNGLSLGIDQVGAVVLGATGGINLYLRFVTDRPLTPPSLPFMQ